jgi:FkbM family methyltransferase
MTLKDFSKDYDTMSIKKIKPQLFDFNFFVTPRFEAHFTNQIYKEMTSLLIQQMAKGVSTFIDIGAHYGFFDVLVAKSNPKCKIIALEPIEENYAILKKNLELHKIEASLHQKAAFNENTTRNFQVSEASDNSGFIANPKENLLHAINVETMTVDSMITEFDHSPLIIKINVEGSEIEVLDGMKKIIKKINDIRLFIEFNPSCLMANGHEPIDLINKLKSLGFQVHFIDDRKGAYYKYNEDSSWKTLLGENSYCNLYCKKEENALNLCFFSHSSQLAGAERSLSSLAKDLIIDYGALCTIIFPKNGPLVENLHNIGCASVIIPIQWWSVNERSHLTNITKRFSKSYKEIKFSELLSNLSPDVVITNTLVIPWGALFAFENDLPHLWMVNEFGEADHGLKFYYPIKSVTSFIDQFSELIITCSQAVKDELFPSSKKAKPIYYSLDDAKSEIASIENEKNVFNNDEAFHLLIPGTLSPGKGQLDAVKAAIELIVNRGLNVELVLIGYSIADYQKKIEALVQEENLQNNIRILSFVEDIYPVMKSADAILVCSKKEAFGRVTVEGMLLQKPVIATNSGGTKELIIDNETGLLYTPGNYFELANKIQLLIENPQLRQKLSENGKSFASSSFSKENFSGVYFEELINLKKKHDASATSESLGMFNIYQDILIGSQKIISETEGNILSLIAKMAEKEETVQKLNAQLAEKEETAQKLNAQLAEKEETAQRLENKISEQEQEILFYALSKSWRVTRPFRKIMKVFKGNKDA